MTTGTFSMRFAPGNAARSRKRWPIWNESLTNEPSIFFSLFREGRRAPHCQDRETCGGPASMTDVLPVVLVGANEDLAIELVSGHGERRHVRRKLKECWEVVYADETQSRGKRFGRQVFVSAGQDEAPFAEGGNVNVIRKSLQAG